jgi:hypothetical protein
MRAIPHFCGNDYIAYAEGFIKRTAESDIANGRGPGGDENGGEGAISPCAIGDGSDIAALPSSGASPMHRQFERANLLPVGDHSCALAGIGGDKED